MILTWHNEAEYWLDRAFLATLDDFPESHRKTIRIISNGIISITISMSDCSISERSCAKNAAIDRGADPVEIWRRRSNPGAPASRRLQNPVAVERERCDAGEAAAARGVVRAG